MRTFHQTGGRIAQRGRLRGLTMVELMITIAISAVLVVMVAPMYTNTLAGYRVMTEGNTLVGDLQYARSEAIKRGIAVQMCISTNQTSCSSSATSWTSGYIVMDANSVVLRAQPAFSTSDTMGTSPSSVVSVSFNREGFASLSSAYLHLQVYSTTNTSLGECAVVSKVGQISQVARGASDNLPSGSTC